MIQLHKNVILKGGTCMRQQFGWFSIGIVILTFTILFTFPINGIWADSILIGGLVIALLMALLSKKGLGKKIAFLFMSVLLIFFVLSVLNFLGFFV